MSLRTVDGAGRIIPKIISEVCPVGCNDPSLRPSAGLISDRREAEKVRQENIEKEMCFQKKVLSCKWRKYYICQYELADLYLRLLENIQ